MTKPIYYLPGAGGRIDTGLGQALIDRGYFPYGRETVGDFRKLPFQEQLDLIAQDLMGLFWTQESFVVANSYGAYLLLNTLAGLEPYIGKVLLLSPIVGEFSSEEHMRFFVPPRSGRLQELVDVGQFPTLRNCQIHVGEDDWQSIPANVMKFAEPLEIPVTVVPKGGHMLEREYVAKLLDEWL